MVIKLWKPRKLRYESRFKNMGVLNLKEKKSLDLIYGVVGLRTNVSGLLSYNQLEAVRRVITRFLKRDGKVIIRVRPETLLTKKPVGVRMGKGKGKGTDWVCKVKSGSIILEIKIKNIKKGKEALRLSKKKLPISTEVVDYKF